MGNYFKTTLTAIFAVYISICTISLADVKTSKPEKDLQLIQGYFKKRFPDVSFDDFANGVYALDPIARENWEALEEFPPYEMHVDTGEELWVENVSAYQACFPNGPAIKHLYPQWDPMLKTVITVPYAINQCRKKYKLSELDYLDSEMNNLVSYIAHNSRGNIINIQVPNEQAQLAYQQGKKYYFTRRGQLNFACFHCHFDNAGKKLRAESLGPALGQTTGWPTYRNKWGELGPLHRRYIGCNKQVRASPLEAQSETYRNLEYFHTHMNNGLPINGPSVRR